MKPAWGGDGIGVRRASASSLRAVIAEIRSEVPDRPLLMQRYVPEIEAGEWSLIFVAGRFRHAVLKQPAAGDFRVNSRFGGKRGRQMAPETAVASAALILSAVQPTPLYARVDGVIVDQRFVCIELELTDPNLYLDLAPDTAASLAEETVRLARTV